MPTAAHPLYAAFAEAMRALPAASSYALAISGGPDSMALALLAHAWAEPRGIVLHAITVEHGLRAESANEAEQVAQWMDARRIPHNILRWETPVARQQDARDARYALMAKACRARSIHYLLLAHHRDDQAETLLLRLKRGSHVHGLAGMRSQSNLHGITLLRPLLAVPKAELIAFLSAQGQSWVEDPSNHSLAYDRNRLRHLMASLPDRERLVAQLAATATALGTLRDDSETQLAGFFTDHVREESGHRRCDLAAFLQAPLDLQHAILRALMAESGRPHPPRFADQERLHAAILTGDCRRTLHGCIITRHGGALRVEREHAALA